MSKAMVGVLWESVWQGFVWGRDRVAVQLGQRLSFVALTAIAVHKRPHRQQVLSLIDVHHRNHGRRI
jgi:hypothetical protein